MGQALSSEIDPVPIVARGRNRGVPQLNHAERTPQLVVGPFHRHEPRCSVCLGASRFKLSIETDQRTGDAEGLNRTHHLVHGEAFGDARKVEREMGMLARTPSGYIQFKNSMGW